MTISDNFVYSAAEVTEIDKMAMHLSGIPGLVLMRRAADYSYEKSIEFYPETDSIIVFCGVGNNAGDGYLFAVRALREGKKIQVVSLSPKSSANFLKKSLAIFFAVESISRLPICASFPPTVASTV